MRLDRLGVVVLIVCGWLTPCAWAWHGGGHDAAVRAAVASLPQDMPEFFRQGADALAHSSVDPDTYRNPAVPQLGNTEEPEHYVDWELLEDKPLPATRYEFLKLCQDMKLDPRKVGLLPYSVTEWTQRLTLAMAEYRRWPDDPYIRAKCLYIAAILSHYSADVCQPLHLTIHYDGQARPDRTSPRSGIHAKVDALIENARLNADSVKLDPPQAFNAVFPAVLAEIQRGRQLIDRVYELESKLPSRDARPSSIDPQLKEFASERLAAAAQFTANLYLTAWRDSAKVEFPRWLNPHRPPEVPESPPLNRQAYDDRPVRLLGS